MKIYLDTGDPAEVEDMHASIQGVTCNPILCKGHDIEKLVHMCYKYDLELSMHHDPRGGVMKLPFLDQSGTPLMFIPPDVDVNITGLLTIDHIKAACALNPYIVSVFFGRAYDILGAKQFVHYCDEVKSIVPHDVQLLWASVRSVGDVTSADQLGVDIVTVPPAILRKYDALPASLKLYELQTARDLA